MKRFFMIFHTDFDQVEANTRLSQNKTLSSKVRGFYQYFGVRSNFKVLEVVFKYTQKAWKTWLGRRHRDRYVSQDKFNEIMLTYLLPLPRIVHNNEFKRYLILALASSFGLIVTIGYSILICPNSALKKN